MDNGTKSGSGKPSSNSGLICCVNLHKNVLVKKVINPSIVPHARN